MADLTVVPGDLRDAANQIENPVVKALANANIGHGALSGGSLDTTQDALTRLSDQGDTVMSFIKAGSDSQVQLASKLHAAHRAYGLTDEAAANSLKSVNGSLAGSTSPEAVLPGNWETTKTPGTVTTLKEVRASYGEVESMIDKVTAESGSVSSQLGKVSTEWNAARGFVGMDAESINSAKGKLGSWEGGAKNNADSEMTQLHDWVTNEMQQNCDHMSTQASNVAAAHAKLQSAMPTKEEVAETKRLIKYNTDMANNAIGKGADWLGVRDYAGERDKAIKHLKELQQQSDNALQAYQGAVSGATPQLNPKQPPPYTDGGSKGGTKPGGTTGGTTGGPTGGNSGGSQSPGSSSGSGNGQTTPASTGQDQQSPSSGQGEGSGSGSPESGSGSPSGGSASPTAGQTPNLDGLTTPSGLGDPAAGGGAGSGAGGGGGGATGSAATAPLAGAPVAGQVASAGTSPAGTHTGTGAGGGMGGGMGGGGMGGGGGHGGGHGGKEKKRNPGLAEDEDMYTEDRAWTEGVIGVQRRRDTPTSRDK